MKISSFVGLIVAAAVGYLGGSRQGLIEKHELVKSELENTVLTCWLKQSTDLNLAQQVMIQSLIGKLPDNYSKPQAAQAVGYFSDQISDSGCVGQ